MSQKKLLIIIFAGLVVVAGIAAAVVRTDIIKKLVAKSAPKRPVNTAQQDQLPGAAPAPVPRWYGADIHLHGFGCGGTRTPVELYSLVTAADLNIASVLVWGWGYENDAPNFTGKEWPGSTASAILRYDMEISLFQSDLMGHQVLLGLSSLDFPRKLSSLPIADWAQAQGALAGFAHINTWPSEGRFPNKNNGNVPFDVPVRAALGSLDFLSDEIIKSHEGSATSGAQYLWYPLLNSGFKIPIAGGSDYPCLPDGAGNARTLFKKATPGLAYGDWISAIKNGQTVIADANPGWLDFTVNQQGLGSTIDLAAPQQLDITIDANLAEAGAVSLVMNGAVQQTLNFPQGQSQQTIAVTPAKSSWFAVRSVDYHTSPIYVTVAGRPIRANSADPTYFARYIDNLLQQLDDGSLARHSNDANAVTQEMIQAEFSGYRAQYIKARDVFLERAKEAQN